MPAITPLPTPPSRSDPTNFAVNGDAFLGAMPRLANEVNAATVAMNLNSTTDTSTSSVAIAMGAATFVVAAGKSFVPGMYLVIADAAAPGTNSMSGQVVSYSGTSLVMNIQSIRGSGTKASWSISQSAPGGVTQGDYQGQVGVNGTTSGTATAYALAVSPALAAYAVGQSFYVQFHVASGASPTLQVSGLAAPPQLVKQNADGTFSNIVAGDIPLNHRSRVTLISPTQALVEELPSRRLGQVVSTQVGTYASGTTTIPYDNTAPQSNEGDQYLSQTITPLNAASLLEIEVVMHVASTVSNSLIAALFQDAGVNAIAAVEDYQNAANARTPLTIRHFMTAGTVAATTFKVRAGGNSASTFTLNGFSGGGSLLAGLYNSRITIKEYLP